MLSMDGTKSQWNYNLNVDANTINSVIINYLQVNGYVKQNVQGINWWYKEDKLLVGKMSIEYYINNNVLTIYAYLGDLNKHTHLEGVTGYIAKQPFLNQLQPLFNEIDRINNNGYTQNNTGYNNQYNTTMNNYNTNNMMTGNTFQDQINKRNSTLAIVAFIIGIVGMLTSCLGIMLSGLALIAGFYCAIQGLKSNKKVLSIAALAILSMDTIMLIVAMILNILG